MFGHKATVLTDTTEDRDFILEEQLKFYELYFAVGPADRSVSLQWQSYGMENRGIVLQFPKIITHFPLLVTRLRTNGATTPFPHTSYVFMAHTVNNLPLPRTILRNFYDPMRKQIWTLTTHSFNPIRQHLATIPLKLKCNIRVNKLVLVGRASAVDTI